MDPTDNRRLRKGEKTSKPWNRKDITDGAARDTDENRKKWADSTLQHTRFGILASVLHNINEHADVIFPELDRTSAVGIGEYAANITFRVIWAVVSVWHAHASDGPWCNGRR